MTEPTQIKVEAPKKPRAKRKVKWWEIAIPILYVVKEIIHQTKNSSK